jgi:hypothetical protein
LNLDPSPICLAELGGADDCDRDDPAVLPATLDDGGVPDASGPTVT